MQQSIVLCRLTPHRPPARPCLVPRHQQHTYVPATTPDPSPHKLRSFGVADRGSSIRIPLPVQLKGYGYLEDRRPAASESSLGSTRGAGVGRVLNEVVAAGMGCMYSCHVAQPLATHSPPQVSGRQLLLCGHTTNLCCRFSARFSASDVDPYTVARLLIKTTLL